MFDWRNRTVITGAAAVLISGFCVGFLTAKATEGGFKPGAKDGVIPITETLGTIFGKVRDKNAPRSGGAKPAGFAVWKQRLDTSGGSPKACIEFSKPLDSSKSYGDYVMVSPELPSAPAVTVKDSELCVGGFGFTDRRVTLLKGLPAAGKETLKQNADVDFSFGEKPPYVGFAGNGVILPREEADGVAVESLNVSTLAFEVWRVGDRNLVRKSISSPDPTPEGEYDYDWDEDSPRGEGYKVWTGKVRVAGNAGERVTTVFPLGAVLRDLKPGAYVVKVRDASGGRDKKENDQPAQARRWILFTDMALTTYTGSNGVDVVVRSLKTAKPMGSVKVTLVAQNGEELSAAQSTADGRVHFDKALLKGEDALAARMIMAYGPAEDFTATDLNASPMDFSSQGVGGRSDEKLTDGRSQTGLVDGFLYTDRGIYRPGETVRLVAMVRDPDGKAIKDRKGALVVYRPSGVEAFRYPFAKTPQGFATANIGLPKSAPRGQWRAKLLIEGIDDDQGAIGFAVEDFAPQRLGVDVKADAERPLTALNETRAVQVNARFLYGASGSGLEVSGSARVRADRNPFPKFRDYRFGNEQTPFEEQYVDLPQTATDADGNAILPFSSSYDTDQPLSVLMTASVFEPGGRPVNEVETLRIRTKPVYFGVKLDTQDAKGGNTPKTVVNIIGLNAKGDKTEAKGVKVRLISENWNYDWYQQDGRWNWRRTSKDVVVSDKDYDLTVNGVTFDRNLDWGDYRLEVTQAATGAKTVIRFASGWGSSAEGTEAPDFVRLTAGSQTYGQGDTISLTLKSPYKGEAQIAVANDKLIDLKTVSVGDSGTTIRLKTDARWGGGAYIMVSVVQPRDPVDSSKPRRAMGLIYVPLDPKGRKLEVKLDLKDKVLKPDFSKSGQAFVDVPVKVGGAGLGKTARVSVAVVDQGIINLTKFKTPDPVGFYFGKRALGLEYRDDYGRLLDPNMGAPADVFGGDQIGGDGLTTTPIKTVALWSGVVNTGIDGTARVRLPIGKFNGELKVMAVAWTDDAVGSSEDKLTVRQPVVAELALPRFLAPGDKAFATLELNNVEGKPGLYDTVVKGFNGLVTAFKKAFNIGQGQRIQEGILIEAPTTVGVSKINLALNGQGYGFDEDYQIQTRMGWGPQTRTFTAQQAAGTAFNLPNDLLNGLQPGSATVQVSYSPFRGVDPAPIAAALNRYPYGCTEQIVSAAYPWLYVTPGQGVNAARADGIIKAAVNKILDRQSEDGAFGLWRAGDGEAEGWIGAYATDFLVEAKKRGIYVPQDALDKAMNAMRDLSKPEGFTSVSYRLKVDEGPWWTAPAAKAVSAEIRSRASAYALYVLAKGGSGDLARLRWYHDVQFKSERSPVAKAQVGAALALMGDKARARSALRQASQSLGYKATYDWYQSPLRDVAAVIALAYEAGETEIAKGLIPLLERNVKGPDAMNTQEQAQVLKAASRMLDAAGPIKIKGEGVTPVDAANAKLQRFNVAAIKDAKFTNNGSGPIWRTITVTGVPINAPPAEAKGYTIDKAYYTLQGQRIDPSQIVQGQKVLVLISGRTNYAETRPIVVDDALPAGFEIEMTLSRDDAQNGPFRFVGDLSAVDVQEARDDRYVAALDVSANSGFAMAYVARAVTPGDYYLPGAEVKDLYRNDLYARTGGGRLMVSAR
ncbi:alpha-2-macroglobulin [Asticcacaulis sp. YBE204]|uniref:alpha-2-macroglobulin family protein n=1 Tax=Asticcacaulis sp. YBE204 TaxID=1282363 RepID=UPI0003C3ADCD|nr:alpha-2-macroglobulin [Asticcacaulis sp. YBE204]ESQ80963.1 alpha-2-macroglobulin [Asticcacaulis sp. YBE204]